MPNARIASTDLLAALEATFAKHNVTSDNEKMFAKMVLCNAALYHVVATGLRALQESVEDNDGEDVNTIAESIADSALRITTALTKFCAEGTHMDDEDRTREIIDMTAETLASAVNESKAYVAPSTRTQQ